MSNLEELYQDIILDHNKRPRNFHKLEQFSCRSEGLNPLCGDEVEVFIKLVNNVIEEISFQGQGCAISKASASLMTVYLKGKSLSEAKSLQAAIFSMLSDSAPEETNVELLGDLAALSGVRQFHARIKCATLPWHALGDCLKQT